ncbi:histidine kinase [Barnesiella sp. An55]|uniref:sensor histidine kinase n=1 Tax=Barnesiella sp. An55 TaxID=1965646 RepID=UPI000B3902DD|nr:histidine kinase [Barnesiella sp. An55]OUN70845.1 histidine kinase [Barnesiella sp. An55]HIZ27351.1 histidine kinase [Candidatus Barnesiella merdipullorum]
MKLLHRHKRFLLMLNAISILLAFLMHLPELIALSNPETGSRLFPDVHWANVSYEILFTYFSTLLLFFLNIKIMRLNSPARELGWKRVTVTFVITLVVCNLLGKGFVFVHQYFDVPAITAMLHHYLHPLRDILITSIVTGTCYMEHQNRCSQRMLLENEQLRTENLVNQYEALKSQLNPHMLFNSLNTLYSLIRESPDKAQNYLQELSRVMRYTLHDNLAHTVALTEEMSFVRSYIYLLQMRYEENLSFDIDIPQAMLQRQVPPMAVQMLVENAVKHNEISNRNPLTIHIGVEGNSLYVSNRIQPKLSDSSNTCIGLANLSKRYRLLFGCDITIEENEKNFKVTLPLI